ncbi:hypothetical protein [Marinobacterium jannaschii]|uniref:hypothetical protein n=1 Tax=Marinobacterium jannaschii TaxID=64970 RepID=UPI0004845EBC|nr:hypothetical protein [Marinobacterium jannaschii]
MMLQRLNKRDGQAASWLVLFLLLCLFGNCLRGLSEPLLTLLNPPAMAQTFPQGEPHQLIAQGDKTPAVDHAAMGHAMPMAAADTPTIAMTMACCEDSSSGCQLLQDKLLSAGISFDAAHFTPILWLSTLLLVIQLLTQLRLLRYASDPFSAERSFLRGYPRRHLLLAVFRN